MKEKRKNCSKCNEILVKQSETETTDHVFDGGKCAYCDCAYFTQDLLFELSYDGKSCWVNSRY